METSMTLIVPNTKLHQPKTTAIVTEKKNLDSVKGIIQSSREHLVTSRQTRLAEFCVGKRSILD